MKNKIISVLLSAAILFPVYAYSLDTLSEVRYTNENYDMFSHFDTYSIYSYLERNGISKTDLPYIFGGNGPVDLATFTKTYGINIFDIDAITVAGESSDIDTNTNIIIFIQMKQNNPLSLLEKSDVKISGISAFEVMPEKKFFLMQKENLLIIAQKHILEKYLSLSSMKKHSESPLADDFIKEAKGKSMYNRTTYSDAFRKKIRSAFGKNRATTGFIKNNPYIKALSKITQTENGMILNDKRSVYFGILSQNSDDNEQLLKFTHFTLVLASFAISYLESGISPMSAIPTKDPETSSEDKNAIRDITNIAQEQLLKIRTEKRSNGIFVSLDIDDKSNTSIINKIKEKINKGKEEYKGVIETKALNEAIISAREGTISKINEYLSKGYDINKRDENDSTLLSTACASEKSVVVSYLLGKKADPNRIAGDGQSPLIIAASKGNLALVKMLVEAGADVSFQDREEMTAADRARDAGFKDIEAFLKKEAAKKTKK